MEQKVGFGVLAPALGIDYTNYLDVRGLDRTRVLTFKAQKVICVFYCELVHRRLVGAGKSQMVAHFQSGKIHIT